MFHHEHHELLKLGEQSSFYIQTPHPSDSRLHIKIMNGFFGPTGGRLLGALGHCLQKLFEATQRRQEIDGLQRLVEIEHDGVCDCHIS